MQLPDTNSLPHPTLGGDAPLPQSTPQPLTTPRHLAALACMLVAVQLVGCRGRARDDVYIETMAAEIRDLEDQCYEFDYEYRRLEQLNQTLRRDLAVAEQRLADKDTSGSSNSSAKKLPSIFEGNSKRTPDTSGDAESSFRPPSRQTLPQRPVDSLPAPLQNKTPEFGDEDFSIDDLPQIEMGQPMPPPVTLLQPPGSGLSGTPESDLELNLSRIEVPALTAAYQSGSAHQDESARDAQTAPPQEMAAPAIEQITDRRVVEIGFHPTLTRAIDLDDAPGDDGVYLVLQPKNQLGQVVPDPAKVTIVALDPSRPQNNGVISRWDYAPRELQAKIRPIGSQQGVHLSLPWNGPYPQADRVMVLVKYTFANGRQVAAEREIMLSSDEEFKAVWTPRETHSSAPATQLADSPANLVRPASGSTPQEPAPAPVQSAGGFRW